jgi:hypothetical protein
MFNILRYKGNADQNYIELSSHSSQIVYHQEVNSQALGSHL